MNKIFELNPKYINTRRRASTVSLSSIELEDYIKKTIFIIEMSGAKYFNYSKVLNELIATQGFPDRQNSDEMIIFKDCFDSISKQYKQCPNHIHNYTFRLKTNAEQPVFSFNVNGKRN